MNELDPVAVFRIEAAECFEAGLLDLAHELDNKNLIDSVLSRSVPTGSSRSASASPSAWSRPAMAGASFA
jgi:hypothetical protein